MTRSLVIQKWMTYTVLGLLPLWLLDAYILSRYPVEGLTPQLLPLAVVCVAILEGAYAGTGFGMGVGLLWTLTYPGGPELVFDLEMEGESTCILSNHRSSVTLNWY